MWRADSRVSIRGYLNNRADIITWVTYYSLLSVKWTHGLSNGYTEQSNNKASKSNLSAGIHFIYGDIHGVLLLEA